MLRPLSACALAALLFSACGGGGGAPSVSVSVDVYTGPPASVTKLVGEARACLEKAGAKLEPDASSVGTFTMPSGGSVSAGNSYVTWETGMSLTWNVAWGTPAPTDAEKAAATACLHDVGQ